MTFSSTIHEAHYLSSKVCGHWRRDGVTVAVLVIVHQMLPIPRRAFALGWCSREEISQILVVVAHPLYSEIEATLEAPIGWWASSVYGNDGTTLLIACSSKPKTHWRNCPRVLKTGSKHRSPIWARLWRLVRDPHSTRNPWCENWMCAKKCFWMCSSVLVQKPKILKPHPEGRTVPNNIYI